MYQEQEDRGEKTTNPCSKVSSSNTEVSIGTKRIWECKLHTFQFPFFTWLVWGRAPTCTSRWLQWSPTQQISQSKLASSSCLRRNLPGKNRSGYWELSKMHKINQMSDLNLLFVNDFIPWDSCMYITWLYRDLISQIACIIVRNVFYRCLPTCDLESLQ